MSNKEPIKVELQPWEKKFIDALAGNDRQARARVIMRLKGNNEFNNKDRSKPSDFYVGD